MAKCLVTGGAGFIGTHVVNHLIEDSHNVIVLDDLSGGFIENIPLKAKFMHGSVTNHTLVQKIFSEYEFDYVYHFAAYAAEGLSHFIRRFNYENNLIGSVNLINESIRHKVKCFVFTSSIAVYGSATPPMREDMIPMPEDPYGIAKLAVEQDLKTAHEMFGLNYIIFRPHNVYGEYQNIGDRYRNVVGIFMNQLMQKKPLTIFGNGNQTRAFSYIGDISSIIADSVKVKEAYNTIFNIGADKECSINDLAKMVMEVMGVKSEIRYLEPRHEALHAFSDHSKINSVFNKNSSTSLYEGLKRMADWAKKHGIRKTPRFNEIEIYEKLPPIWLEE